MIPILRQRRRRRLHRTNFPQAPKDGVFFNFFRKAAAAWRGRRISGSEMNQRRIAITCGDPAGVGPEIIERWAADHSCQGKRVTVIGPRRWLARCDAFARFSRVEVGAPELEAVPGEPSVEGAKIAMEALEAAAAQCARGEADAVVTAPVSKIWLRKAGFPFPGHTEFFAARWGGEPVMAFAGRRLRIALATWHIPLSDVVRVLDATRIQRA